MPHLVVREEAGKRLVRHLLFLGGEGLLALRGGDGGTSCSGTATNTATARVDGLKDLADVGGLCVGFRELFLELRDLGVRALEEIVDEVETHLLKSG